MSETQTEGNATPVTAALILKGKGVPTSEQKRFITVEPPPTTQTKFIPIIKRSTDVSQYPGVPSEVTTGGVATEANKQEAGREVITREEAIEVLDDGGEHKFLFEPGTGTTYIVGTSLEQLREENSNPRLHEEILQTLVGKGLITNAALARGGYCRVDSGELLFWGPSSHPVEAADEEMFDKAVTNGGIKIIDQWVTDSSGDEHVTQ